MNGNQSHFQSNHTTIGLPPPESSDESFLKKTKRFGGRRKKSDTQNDQFNIPYPPKFIQPTERTFSFGDNSFDADNAAYNLYAFVVRIKELPINDHILFFLLVSLWSNWWWTLCCIC